MIDKSRDNQGQVISNTAAILTALRHHPAELSMDELIRRTELPRSTVEPLLSSLEREAFIIHSHNHIYLGPALSQLTRVAHAEIISVVRTHLNTLANKTGETVELCIFRGQHSLSVDHIISQQELRVASPLGKAFSVYTSAHGKAVLASLSNDEVKAIIDDKWIQQTEASHISYDTLFQDLDLIRKNGWAVDIEEHAEGICAVGVAINAEMTDHYSIAVSLPTIRFNRNMSKVTSALLACKAEVEESIKP